MSSESQAGGYYLIKAEANPGITCVLPAALPVVTDWHTSAADAVPFSD